MNLLEAYSKLESIKQPFLKTRDVSARLSVTTAHASNILNRLESYKQVIRLGRGRWIIGNRYDPLSIAEYVTIPFPTYVSLQTALFHHGIISQIPSIVYAVTLSRSRKVTTPAGTASLHHVVPEFFFGYEVIGNFNVKMATPEKAFIDYLYFYPAKTRIFRGLPEIEFPKSFRLKTAREIIEKIPHRNRRNMVRARFEELYAKNSGH